MVKPILIILLLTVWARADRLQEAREWVERGAYGRAAAEFTAAAESLLASGAREDATRQLLNAAMCLKMDGQISAATVLVERAESVAGSPVPAGLRCELLAQKGSILSLGKRPAKALPVLREARALAGRLSRPTLLAQIENDLGIALGALQNPAEAIGHFDRAERLAAGIGDASLRHQARQNHLIASFQSWQEARDTLRYAEEVGSWSGPAEESLQETTTQFLSSLAASETLLRQSPPSPLSCFHSLSAGIAAQRHGLQAEAFALLRHGYLQASKLGRPRLERAALLTLAEAYLARRQTTDALGCLDHARRITDEAEPSQTARLELLTAETYRQEERSGREITTALLRSIAAMEDIRSDLARTQAVSDLGRPFRERAGRPYLLLADAYLREAERHPSRRKKLYQDARDVIEAFKQWQLNDFYRDDCVNLARRQARRLEEGAGPGVGILYAIPLDDRVELLLSHQDQVSHAVSPASQRDIARLARRFRYDLESDYGSPAAYFEEAEALHDNLIRPLLPALRSQGIRHLVIVPDGALATVPFAALFNRETERYLIEDFSLSVSPSLTLNPGPASGESSPVSLLAGVSEAVPGFPALPDVRTELTRLADLYPNHLLRLNRDFSASSLERDLRENPARIVHIACHGEFKGRATDTFLAASGGERISLDALESAIRPRKYRGQPVDLLCLSACRTAAGDDRAALGLAGAAVKSGSRSVVASLWYVQSTATSRLMVDLHRNLQDGKTSKARALRAAQLDFLQQDPSAHPRLWAPFILIGDWR